MARNVGSSSGDPPRRSDNLQRLIDSADESVNLLASLDSWAAEANTAPRSSQSAYSLGGYSQAPMSTESFYFVTPPASSNVFSGINARENSEEDLNVVDLSVQRGMLHVKGVFPDHSVEYVDVDPRFTTISDLKRALCNQRNSRKELGFAAAEARVMFDGQLVENDWLVVDCGLGVDGVIYIVKGVPAPAFPGNPASKATIDTRLPVASIASSYAQWQPPKPDDDSVFLEFNNSLVLGSTQAGNFSHNVRPEEFSFAEMVADFYQHLGQVQDTDAYSERLLRGYIDVLQSRLEVLESSLESTTRTSSHQRQRLQDTLKELRDERNTWRLLYELRRICAKGDDAIDTLMEYDNDPEELRFDMVEEDAVRALELKNESFKIQKAVKSWLENIAIERVMAVSETRDVAEQGSRTLKLVKKGYTSGSTIRMDADGVFKSGDRHVVDDDAEDEANLLRGVWSYIRAGQLEEAVDLCVRLGESWRAASLSGGVHVGASDADDNGVLERWGNPLRALWKATCWKLAEGKTPKMSKRNSLLSRQYEEIVYAALSGHAQVLTQSQLCETWEDHCWAYLQAMTELQIDETLFKLLKVKVQSSQLIVGNDVHYLRVASAQLEKSKYLKRYQVDIGSLFRDLKSSKNDAVRKEANETYHQIQAKLVTAEIEQVVASMATSLTESPAEVIDWRLRLDEDTAADNVSPFFLRFGAHFVLFASFTEEKMDETASNLILKAYIRHLVKHGHLKLVPIYASRLPVDGAVEVYVQVLSAIEEKLARESFMRRVLEYSSLDVLSTVVLITVERLCTELRAQAKASKTTSDAITRLDRKRMRTVEYLCLFNEHRAEALRRANLLAREFVSEGKFSVLKELFVDHVPEDSVGLVNLHHPTQTITNDDEIERILRGHLCWKAYIRASNHYHLWRSCTAGRGTKAWLSYSEEKEFLTELMYHVAKTTSSLVDVLHFENGWMLHCSDDEQDDLAVRQASLPLLVNQLHFVQLESAKLVLRVEFYPADAKVQLAQPLLEKSLQVADVVADEHYAVAEALTASQCQDLLSGFRESSIALLHLESMMAMEDLDGDDDGDDGELVEGGGSAE